MPLKNLAAIVFLGDCAETCEKKQRAMCKREKVKVQARDFHLFPLTRRTLTAFFRTLI